MRGASAVAETELYKSQEGNGMMRIMTIAVALGVSLGLTGQGLAVDEPESIVKYRQAVMKAIGGHMGSMAAVAKGKVSFVSHVAEHARGINGMSKLVLDIFPKNSGPMDSANTRALPAIWDKWPEFKAASKAMQLESAKLVKVAEGGDVGAIGAQLKNLGKACGGCHKPFRAKKKE